MFNKRNKLNKRLIDATSADDVIRNHAYSRVAGNSKAIPVRRAGESAQTDSNYRNSMVGSINQYRDYTPTCATKPTEASPANNSKVEPLGNRPVGGAGGAAKTGADPVDRRHHFIEPPKRNFNRFN